MTIDLAAIVRRVCDAGSGRAEALHELRRWLSAHVPDLHRSLVDTLEADDDEARCVAAWCLHLLVPYPPTARDAVAARLRDDPCELVRRHCVEMLGYLAPRASETMRSLVGALDDENAEVRLSASMSLEWVGPAALRDDGLDPAGAATDVGGVYRALARWRITTEEADREAFERQLFRALLSCHENDRPDLVYLLGLLGSGVRDLGAVAVHLADPNPRVRALAARCLGYQGARAMPFRERIVELRANVGDRESEIDEALLAIGEDRLASPLVRRWRGEPGSPP